MTRHPDRLCAGRPELRLPGLLPLLLLGLCLAPAACGDEVENVPAGAEGPVAIAGTPAAEPSVAADFDLEGYVHGRIGGHHAGGLVLVTPPDRDWRPLLGQSPALLRYEVRGIGISGRVLLLPEERDPKAVIEGFTGRIGDAETSFETIEAGGRSFVMATVVTAPITLRFAACRRGDAVLLLQHLADAEVAALARDDALAFLGAVIDVPPGDRDLEERNFSGEDGGPGAVIVTRATKTILPRTLVSPALEGQPLLADSEIGAIETIPLRDGSVIRSCSDRFVAGLDPAAILRALFADETTPGTLEPLPGAAGTAWRGQVLHEDAVSLHAIRRFGSIWQGLRVTGADKNEVSRRFDRLLPYLRKR